MPPLPEHLTFESWRRSKLFERATEQGGRLESSLSLVLSDTNTGQQADGASSFKLMSAADIAGLKPGAIKHTAPSPFASDAETTKFVHVEFWEPDLPWRYTPRKNDPQMQPWLVLLVGTGEEIQVESGIATVKDSVLSAHNLTQSHSWAHTQCDGFTTISRILSRRVLNAQSEYVALLVPAFNQEGQEMWTVVGNTVQRSFGDKGILPAFHSWRFWTAQAGDFETLAAALHLPEAGDVGKAKLHYRRNIPADNVAIDALLEVRGAITSLQQEAVSDNTILQSVRADLDLLNNELPDTIGLPQYGRPWLPDLESVPNGWPADINDDPRFRGIAGLGLWMGVEAQEALMDAAVQQAGALREAGQRIGHLALGIWSAGRLWDRRLPTDKLERLSILGPIMSRMVASDGGIVLDRVTSGNSPLSPALFSSAAQRILRDRSAQTRHVEGAGGIKRSDAFAEANKLERQPERAPEGLPHVDRIAKELGLLPLEKLFDLDSEWIDKVLEQLFRVVRKASAEYRQKRDKLRRSGSEDEILSVLQQIAQELTDELAAQLQALLSGSGLPCEELGGQSIISAIGAELPGGVLELISRALESDAYQNRLRDTLWRELRRCMSLHHCQDQISHVDIHGWETFCDDMLATLHPEPRSEQKPVDLGRLSDMLYSALDPRKPDAPARVRVCSQIRGVDCTRLIPPDFPIGLDFPTWDLLRKHDKEWLLPGVGALESDSITALQTNPAFIDAYMLGINTQFMSEMRWRDLAVERTCTPLRMFWGQVNYATQERQADIEPLGEWAKAPAEPIGARSHQSIQPHDPSNTSGSRLVIAFCSELFRRYPSTLVYLIKPPAGLTETQLDELLKSTPQLDKRDEAADAEQWRKDRTYFGPIFAGTITPQLTFFAFDVTPSDLDQYWLVLDEPPAELRFKNDVPIDDIDATNSATFAESTLDKPTRVAISGAELKRQGNNP